MAGQLDKLPIQLFYGLPISTATRSSTEGVPITHFTGPVVEDTALLTKSLQEVSLRLRDLGAHTLGNPFASSILIRNVTLVSGQALTISHYLGRAVTTWAVLRPRPTAGGTLTNGSPVYESNPQPTGTNATSQIQLVATQNAIVDLLFA